MDEIIFHSNKEKENWILFYNDDAKEYTSPSLFVMQKLVEKKEIDYINALSR